MDPDARRTEAVRRLARWNRRASVYGTLDPGGAAARFCGWRQRAAEADVDRAAAFDAADDQRAAPAPVPTGDDAHQAAAAEHYRAAFWRYAAAADRIRAGDLDAAVEGLRAAPGDPGEEVWRDRHDRRW